MTLFFKEIVNIKNRSLYETSIYYPLLLTIVKKFLKTEICKDLNYFNLKHVISKKYINVFE